MGGYALWLHVTTMGERYCSYWFVNMSARERPVRIDGQWEFVSVHHYCVLQYFLIHVLSPALKLPAVHP